MNFTNLLIDYIIVLNIGLLVFLVIFTRILKKELKENILNIICVIGGIFSLIFLSIKPKNKLLYIISFLYWFIFAVMLIKIKRS
jgi:hypothetical protein